MIIRVQRGPITRSGPRIYSPSSGRFLGFLAQTEPATSPAAVPPPEGLPAPKLGQNLSPAQLLDAITVDGVKLSSWQNGNSFQKGTYQQCLTAISTSQILLSNDPQYITQNACGGATSSLAPRIVNTAGSVAETVAPLAIHFAATAATAATLIPIVGAAIGGALLIFDTIFGAHAAKVAAEHQVLCASVPAANDSLQAIIQALQNGTITAQQGIASLYQLYEDFVATVSPVTAQCASPDAGCGWTAELACIVANLAQQWTNNPPGGGLSLGSLTSSGTLPWLLGGAALLLVIGFAAFSGGE
jgi:hypothetical protein